MKKKRLLEEEYSSNTLNNREGMRKRKKKFIFIIVIIAIIFGIGYVSIKSMRSTFFQKSPEAIQKAAQEAELKEIESITEKISRHLILPKGEIPTMATVIDATALIAQQPFYRDTVDGDKVLIYLQNQQAIIYSPSRDIIVNVGPLVLEDE